MVEKSSRKDQEVLNREKVRFAAFEVNFAERELTRDGARVPLQHKPFRILEILLREPGALVTRKELAKDLWPDLHVSFEQSLNSAVNTLRQVLGDSPRESLYIETRSGLGYRFIAPVETVAVPTRPPHKNGSASHDCLRGRYFLNKMTDADLQRGIGCFQSALQEGPDCAAAHAGLADAYCQLALGGTVSASDVFHLARQASSAALRLAPQLAEAHVSLGRLHMVFDWDWNGAAAAFERASELDPVALDAHRGRALLRSALNKPGEALADIRRAHTLDPLSLPVGHELAWLLYLAEDFSGATSQCWATLSLEPRFFHAQNILGLTYMLTGAHDEGITELENACVCSERHPSAVASLGYSYAVAGLQESAQQILNELTMLSRRQHISPYWIALIHAGFRQSQAALEALQQACAQRDPLLLWLNVDPRLAYLRAEAGFSSLLRRVGFC